VTREIVYPCSRCRRRSGEINSLEHIPVDTKAADDKLAAFVYARILDRMTQPVAVIIVIFLIKGGVQVCVKLANSIDHERRIIQWLS
jgi:hypothetical protein